jgi:CDP-glucose 4,6-dehydratase
VKLVEVVTSDKVYANTETGDKFSEGDRLWGYDPYSASKVGAEIACSAWRRVIEENDLNLKIVTVRSGNVIGGGDWSVDRLVPDLVTAILSGKDLVLRNPEAVRPWQHVLDCLNGYLLLVDSLLTQNTDATWNFGPRPESNRTVKDVVEGLIKNWETTDTKVKIETDKNQLKESNFLLLDSTKSREKLGWNDKLDFEETLRWTTEWYKAHSEGESAEALMLSQISKFLTINPDK